MSETMPEAVSVVPIWKGTVLVVPPHLPKCSRVLDPEYIRNKCPACKHAWLSVHMLFNLDLLTFGELFAELSKPEVKRT